MTMRAHIKSLFYHIKSRCKGEIAPRARIMTNVLLDYSGGGFLRMAAGAELSPGVMVWTQGGVIAIGENSRIGPACILYGHGGLTIGRNVIVAGQTMMVPANHVFTDVNVPIKDQGQTAQGITIEDDVWIGAGVKILDGVRIGAGAVVAAGAVVNRDVPARAVVAGVPARVIKMRGISAS
jgi:acetyltransferase-like isoleucine patch superfamily enzyme